MRSIETKYFGTLPCSEDSVFDFPQGLPAFEEEKSFLLIEPPEGEPPEAAPLVFLQSMARASLCFAALPILVVDGGYELGIAPEDLEDLGLEVGRQPALGSEVMVLALLTVNDEFGVTANLMAPIVLNLRTRRGLQAIRRDSRYFHEHPVAARAVHEKTREDPC
jgi:flagellar assembly factor FliW